MNHIRAAGYEINTVSHIIKRTIDIKSCYEGESFSGRNGWLIDYLYRNRDKNIFQRDIENVFNIRRSTVTGIIQSMEKNGLVIRKSVENDARLKKLELTQKAIDYHSFFKERIREVEKLLKKDIDEKELEIFFEVIEKMKNNLSNEEKRS